MSHSAHTRREWVLMSLIHFGGMDCTQCNQTTCKISFFCLSFSNKSLANITLNNQSTSNSAPWSGLHPVFSTNFTKKVAQHTGQVQFKSCVFSVVSVDVIAWQYTYTAAIWTSAFRHNWDMSKQGRAWQPCARDALPLTEHATLLPTLLQTLPNYPKIQSLSK